MIEHPLVSWEKAFDAAPPRTPELWTFEELSARWHCSARTVARIVGSRTVRMGRKPLVRADVVAAIEREREGL